MLQSDASSCAIDGREIFSMQWEARRPKQSKVNEKSEVYCTLPDHTELLACLLLLPRV